MSLYLRTKKLDRTSGGQLELLLHNADAKNKGINNGDLVAFSYHDLMLYAEVELTDTEIQQGEVGLYEEFWGNYRIPSDEIVVVNITSRPESIEYIKKKLLGKKLNENELAVIMQDISDRKIREVEIAYFMASFFNPGFDENEVLYTAKGMAKAGDILDFKEISKKHAKKHDLKGFEGMVIDKHSIGGVAAKGVTPILVPTIAAFGFTIPNTSTRAITTPAGTSDILETVMPVNLDNEEIYSTVEKTGGSMLWGGAIKLAPADDILIHVERGLHIQSYQKLLVSIVAKKIAIGLTHILVDIPYGPGSKVEDPDDVELLEHSFKNLFAKVGITCGTFTRRVTSTDGNGVGPILEMKDILKVLDQEDDRPRDLENLAADMAGALLELVGYAPAGKGKQMALDKIQSGATRDKFWEIAKAQGAKKIVKSKDLAVGDYSYEVLAEQEGTIEVIDNKEVVKIARSLGNPFINQAGMYIHKRPGDKIKVGDKVVTLYATSSERLEMGKHALDCQRLFRIKV
jgi:AMP phosphorylase